MKISKNLFYALIVLAFISISLALYMNALAKNKIYRITELDMQLKVGNYTGFNIGTDKIYFGTIPGGGSGKRIITINNLNAKSEVIIEKKGDLANWVFLEEDKFLIEPNEIRNITVTAFVPKDAEFKEYAGKLRILFTRIKNE